MSYVMKKNIANKSNYGGYRGVSAIKYIGIHMTANDGDHDESNGNYFHNNANLGASAHYFVDSDSITQSVPDDYIAYSVGKDYRANGGGRLYGICTNANSISIELCDDVKNGTVYPSAATIANAIAFTKELMKKYNIDSDHVIRHWDVNGKRCPSYWVNDSKWESEFHSKLSASPVKIIPALASPTVKNGSKGVQARLLQDDLNYVMKAGLTIDGIIGPKSIAALKKFQTKYGLVADGIYGVKSQAKMKSLLK